MAKKILLIGCLSLLIVSLYLLSTRVLPARASVTFASFTAEWDGEAVVLEWETSAEADNDGFYVLKSQQQNTGFTPIADSFQETTDNPDGDLYFYDDYEVEANKTYWYQIQAQDLQGSYQFSQKVSVVVAAAATSTPVPTATSAGGAYPPPGSVPTVFSTSTPDTYPGPGGNTSPVPTSQAPVPATATATSAQLLPTLTPAPASSPTPGTAFPTPTAYRSEGITTTDLSPSATLIPLPPLTLIFPEPTVVAMLVTATPGTEPASPWSSPQRLVPLALVAMIWVILGAWFYYSQRNIT